VTAFKARHVVETTRVSDGRGTSEGGKREMTEKDRYGETLRDREKGEEDRYAAEQDRLRIERLRQQAQVVQAMKGLCPQCGAPLSASKKLDASVQTCEKCRGVWLAIDDLERVMARAGEGEIVRFFRSLLS
jgi:ribosomal protein L37AE/L43A